MYTGLIFSLFAIGVSAIKVTSPTDDDVWASGTSGQTVSWEAVNTDATSFAIQLINQAGFLSNSPVTLVANQSTGSANQVNSVTVNYPSGNWPVGTAFQINLVSSANGNSAILAQSQQFNITSSGSSSSSSSSSSSTSSSTGTAPTTMSTSRSASSTIPPVTAGANGGSSSSGVSLPNAVTSTGSADMVFGTPSTFIGAMMAGAALIGVTF